MWDELKADIIKGKDIENLLEKHNWKNFESVVAAIFQENGFQTKQNFRFKTKSRYEIDVLAINRVVFCVDCKWWGRGRYKKSGLRGAIISQKKRVEELQKFLKRNPIAKGILRIDPKYVSYPLIVTLHDEDMVMEDETFVVPVWKLNQFILERENYF
jgi:hypothetical protein